MMPDPFFLQAIYPLLEDGLLDALEWSFDTVGSTAQYDYLDGLLDAFSSEGKLIGHGVYYSLFDARWTKRQILWLKHLKKELCKRKYTHISEHFGYMSEVDYHKGFPLPVSLNSKTLQIGIDRIKRLQDVVQLPVGVENLAFSFSKNDVLQQGEFIEKLIDSVGGFILLDLHNIYCQSHNFETDMDELVKCYPLNKVKELHLSGGSWQDGVFNKKNKVRRDTHDDNVPLVLLEYLPQALAHCKYVDFVILERLGDSFKKQDDLKDFRNDFKNIKKIVEDSNVDFSQKKWNKIDVKNSHPIQCELFYNEQRQLADFLLNKDVNAIVSLPLKNWETAQWDKEMVNTGKEISKKWH